jgi:hypothetical protein
MKFCGSFPAHEERPQLYNDPANATLKVVLSLLTEMSTLFTDEYFNIGSDETFSFANAVGPNCSGSNSAGLEQAVADYVRSVWGRRVMGWDALKTTGNQTRHGPGRKGGLSDTAKVYWHGAPSSETIVSGGIDWVAASKDHSYLDHGTPPSGFWWDIREGNKKNSNGTETTSLLSTGLLGGEVCHWTDKYCYIFECLTTWHDPFSESFISANAPSPTASSPRSLHTSLLTLCCICCSGRIQHIKLHVPSIQGRCFCGVCLGEDLASSCGCGWQLLALHERDMGIAHPAI